MATVPLPALSRKFLLPLCLAPALLALSGTLQADPNAAVDYFFDDAGNTGFWSDATNWNAVLGTPGAPPPVGGPSGAGLYVDLIRSISSSLTINLHSNADAGIHGSDPVKVVGRLYFGDSNASDATTIAAGVGSGILQLDGNGGTAIVNSQNGSNDVISAPVRLATSAEFYGSQVGVLTVSGSVTGVHTSGQVNIGSIGNTTRITGAISNGAGGGTVGVLVNGGRLELNSNSSSYTGTTVVRKGTLTAGNSNVPNGGNGSFGNSTTAVQLGDSGTAAADAISLLMTVGFTMSRDVVVNSQNSSGTTTIGTSSTSANTAYAGDITLHKSVTLLAAGSGKLSFTKSITVGSGSNNVVNITSTGGTGTIELRNAGTNLFAPDAFNVVNGTLALGGSNQIAGATNLTVSGGTFNIVNFSDNLGAVSLTAGAITGTTGTLTGTSYDLQAGTVSAKIGGSGTLAKTGAGTVIISSANTGFTGAVNITAGTLLIQTGGSISSASLVTVGGTGTLGGGGTVGAVTVENGGTVGPGASAGILATGALTFKAGSHFAIELAKTGATPVTGTDYDQLSAGGDVSLTGADLALTLNGGIAEGDIFYILSNTTGNATLGDGFFTSLNGVATPLTQGAEFTFGGQAFRISYDAVWTGDAGTSTFTGGGGNDIALLALVPEPAPGGLLIGGLSLSLLARRRRSRQLSV